MSSEWPKVQLASLLSEKPRNGLYKGAKYQGAGCRWIKMKDIYGNDLIEDQSMSLIEVTQTESERFGCEDGDLLFGRTSLTLEGIGDCALVCNPCDRPIFESNLFRLRFDLSVSVPRFYYYFFKSYQGKELIQSIAKQTAATSITATDLIRLDVPFPDLAKQNEISIFLESLDNRITLLRETNATLEAIAQALFKSWFVDFDPVRAKAEGREPEGMDATTAALFPDSFEESELGLVPKGWRVEWLADVFDFKEGPGIRNWQYTNSDIGTRFINIRCIQDGDLSIETANRISDEEANGKYAHFHLKAWDVVVSTSGTLGRSAIVRDEHLPLMLNTSVIRFRPVEGKTSFSFVYEYLNAPEFLFKLESMASGSVQKNFGPMHLKQMKLVCPPSELITSFEFVARPLFDKIVANRAQAQGLTQLRDTLLPRLISGQLRLPEALAEVEGAVA